MLKLLQYFFTFKLSYTWRLVSGHLFALMAVANFAHINFNE